MTPTAIFTVWMRREYPSREVLKVTRQLLRMEKIKNLFYFSPVWSSTASPLNKRISLDTCLFEMIPMVNFILSIVKVSSWD